MNTLVEKINTLSGEQKFLKNQRKSINIIGERIIDSSEASWKHSNNRVELRELNVALGLIKGRELSQIESNPKTTVNMHSVNKIIDNYNNGK